MPVLPESVVDALAHLWQGIVTHGCRQLAAPCSRVSLSRRSSSDSGEQTSWLAGASSISRCVDPSRYFEQGLNQVLGYALLDWPTSSALTLVAPVACAKG